MRASAPPQLHYTLLMILCGHGLLVCQRVCARPRVATTPWRVLTSLRLLGASSHRYDSLARAARRRAAACLMPDKPPLPACRTHTPPCAHRAASEPMRGSAARRAGAHPLNTRRRRCSTHEFMSRATSSASSSGNQTYTRTDTHAHSHSHTHACTHAHQSVKWFYGEGTHAYNRGLQAEI